MASPHDWQTEIRARAAREGVALTDGMTEEIAEHLEDLYAGAIREGCTETEAQARARGPRRVGDGRASSARRGDALGAGIR